MTKGKSLMAKDFLNYYGFIRMDYYKSTTGRMLSP